MQPGKSVPFSLEPEQIENILSIRPDGCFLIEMVKLFTDRGRELLAEIDASVAASDPRAFLAHIHALKGASQTIGARLLTNACHLLETNLNFDKARIVTLHVEFSRVVDDLRLVIQARSNELSPPAEAL